MKIKLSTGVISILIVILILVAIALAWAIFQRSGFSIPFLSNNQNEQENNGTDVSALPIRAIPAGLTEAEVAVFENNPGINATTDEKNKFLEYVKKAAVQSKYLNISQCGKPFPLVLQIKAGEEFTILNDASIEHMVIIDQKAYKVGPGEQVVAGAANGGVGVYGYSCDNSILPSGYIYITSK